MTASIADTSSFVTLTGTSYTTPTMTWTHVVTSTTNRLLIVMPSGESGITPKVAWSGVTYGGVSLTKLTGVYVDEGANVAIDVWYLVNPTVGSASVVCTGDTGAVMSHGGAVAYTYQDAAQSAPQVYNSTGVSIDGTTISCTVTTLTANVVVLTAIVTNVEDACTPNTGTAITTFVGSPGEGGARFASASLVKTSAGSQTITYTSAGTFGRAAQVILGIGSVGDTLGLTDIVNRSVIQRSALTTGSVSVSGTYAGSVTSVEARIVQDTTEIVTWTSTTASSGTYSKTFTGVAVGGNYHFEVRGKDSGGTVLTTIVAGNTWGIGAVILVAGSSTSEKWFTDSTSETSNSLVSKYSGSTWASITGAASIAFSNSLLVLQPGVPIGLIDSGVSGSLLSGWYADDSNYLASISDVTGAGGVIEAIICHVGSNDARYGTVVQSTHKSQYETLISNWRADTTKASFLSTLPVILTTCQRCPTGEGGENWTRARAAEMELCDETGVFLGAMVEDLDIDTDNTHLTPNGMRILGRRCAYSYSVNVLGQSISFKGPKPTSVAYSGTSITVTFSLNGGTQLYGLIAQSGITGFRVSTDSFATLQPISSSVITSTTTVVLTVPSGLSGIKVDYLCGANPDVSNCLGNNAAFV